jgi:hypothetical protein
MRCSYLTRALVIAFCAAAASGASAQTNETGMGFNEGYVDVGPVVGVGGINGASASFGGRFEMGLKELPKGVLGLGVSADYYSFNSTFSNVTGFSWTFLPIAVTVNYHFHLDNRKIDPFVGAGLGYEHASVSGPSCLFAGIDLCSNAYSSGAYFVGHGGIRYFFMPNMAVYADVGSRSGALHGGIMFKIK